jgi:predicted outer membrane repeat protein
VTVSNSTLSGNSAGDPGGGIANYGTLTVSNSTLSGNSAYAGGGIFNYNPGMLTVSNSTLSGNSANYGGGGIYTDRSRTVTLTNVTLTDNRSGTGGAGGGLFVGSGLPVLHNTLIAGNFRGATGTTRDDVSGALDPNGDYNLIGDGSGMTGLSNGVNGNQVGSASIPINPLLGPLQDNGGPTFTHALMPGSPALNAGDPSQLGVADQRGVLRSGGVNIGAYEASASAFVLTVPGTATAGTSFDATVKAVDSFGQTALGYTGTVHFDSTDGQAVVSSDYPYTSADAGTHTFTNGFTLKTAGNQTVTATDTATASISGSATFAVNPAAADHLLFLQQPTDAAAGQTLSPVMVEVVDAFGNVETGDSDTITLSIGSNPSGGTLSGTLTLTVVNGVATFSDLSIDQAGDGYTLHATVDGGLADIDSDAFSIT